MKDIITTVASVLILMMFMTQFVANEKTCLRVFAADSIINRYEEEWQSEGDINELDILKLNRELDDRLNGKVVICGLDRSESIFGIYGIKMKVYDVIGPYRLLSSYNGENAAMRVRNIRIERKQEESPDEKHDNNHGIGDVVLDVVDMAIQHNR